MSTTRCANVAWSSMLQNWTTRSSTRDGARVGEDVGGVAELVAGLLLVERSIDLMLAVVGVGDGDAGGPMSCGADGAVNNALEEVELLLAGLVLEETKSLLMGLEKA